MSNLRKTIEGLASEFAGRIIAALRAASLEELSSVAGLGRGERGGRASAEPAASRKRAEGGRLPRRSQADIDRMIDEITSLLQGFPEGLRAEQIREALACEAKELPRPLADAVQQGRLTKTGQKRATTYFAGKGAGGRGASAKAAGAKKRGRGGRPKKRAAA